MLGSRAWIGLGALCFVGSYAQPTQGQTDGTGDQENPASDGRDVELAEGERAADETAVSKLQRALAFLSTHPVTDERVRSLRRALELETFEALPWLEESSSWDEMR